MKEGKTQEVSILQVRGIKGCLHHWRKRGHQEVHPLIDLQNEKDQGHLGEKPDHQLGDEEFLQKNHLVSHRLELRTLRLLRDDIEKEHLHHIGSLPTARLRHLTVWTLGTTQISLCQR